MLERLDAMLAEISVFEPIEYIDLYGGEVAILPERYLEELFDVIERYYPGQVSIITNLSRIHPTFLRRRAILSVSYDFDCRQQHEQVFDNMMKYGGDLHVLMLAGRCLIEKDVDEMIRVLNAVANVKTVEIKPYSTNQHNAHGVSFRNYEEFVKKWLVSPIEKRFKFINQQLIENSLAGKANSFSDDHVYITPHGKFAVLEFDANDNEYFEQLDTLLDYYAWTQKERKRVFMNGFCATCPYLGHCLSEHLREVKTLEHSCNGFRHLLDWYKDERMANKTTVLL